MGKNTSETATGNEIDPADAAGKAGLAAAEAAGIESPSQMGPAIETKDQLQLADIEARLALIEKALEHRPGEGQSIEARLNRVEQLLARHGIEHG